MPMRNRGLLFVIGLFSLIRTALVAQGGADAFLNYLGLIEGYQADVEAPPIEEKERVFKRLLEAVDFMTDEAQIRKAVQDPRYAKFAAAAIKPIPYLSRIRPLTLFSIFWRLGDDGAAAALQRAGRTGLGDILGAFREGIDGKRLERDAVRLETFLLSLREGLLPATDHEAGRANIEAIKDFHEALALGPWQPFLDRLVDGGPYEIYYSDIGKAALAEYLSKNPYVDAPTLANLLGMAPRFKPEAWDALIPRLMEFGAYRGAGKAFWALSSARDWKAGLDEILPRLEALIGAGAVGREKQPRREYMDLLGQAALSGSVPGGMAGMTPLFCLIYALDKDEYWKLIDSRAEELCAIPVLVDGSEALFMNADIDAFFAKPARLKLYLALVSAGRIQDAFLRRALLSRLEGLSIDPAELAFPASTGRSLRDQVLDFVMAFYGQISDQEGRPDIPFLPGLWRILEFPSGSAQAAAWTAFLAERSGRLEFNSFKDDRALAYMIKNIWTTEYRKGSPEAVLFDKLYLDAYLTRSSEAGFMETSLVPRLNREAPAFIKGLAAYMAGWLSANDRAEPDYERRFRLYQFLLTIADQEPGALKTLMGILLTEYRDDFRPRPSGLLIKEKETIQKEFFRLTRESTVSSLDYSRYLLEGGGERAAGRGEDALAEAALAATVMKTLRRLVELLNGPEGGRFQAAFDEAIGLFKDKDARPVSIPWLVENQRLGVRRSFEFVTALMDDKIALADIKAELINGENLEALVDLAEAVDGQSLTAFLRSKAALDPGMDAETRAAEEDRMRKVLEGISRFFFSKVNEQTVRWMVQAVAAIDSVPPGREGGLSSDGRPSLTRKMVQTIVKVIFYHQDQAESQRIGNLFLALFGASGSLGAKDPDLMPDFARVYFFRNRGNAQALKAQFDELLARFRSSPGAASRDLIGAMLVFAEDAEVLAYISAKVEKDQGLLAALGNSERELTFIYKVYKAGALLVRLRQGAGAAARAAFSVYAPALKEIFQDNYLRLLDKPSLKDEIELDLELRSLLLSVYESPELDGPSLVSNLADKAELRADPEAERARKEALAAVFSFFVNEKEVTSGKFTDRDIFYFPRAKLFVPRSDWERRVEEAVGTGRLFLFLTDGVKYSLGSESKPSIKKYAQAIVYLYHAAYLRTRGIQEAMARKDMAARDQAWESLRDALYAPLFRGDFFPAGSDGDRPFFLHDAVAFPGNEKAGGLYYLYQNLYANWLKDDLPEPARGWILERFIAFVGDFIKQNMAGGDEEQMRFLAAFMAKASEKAFNFKSQASKICPTMDEFLENPFKPAYYVPFIPGVDFRYNLRAGDRLMAELTRWYSWDPRDPAANDQYFYLMPGFSLGGDKIEQFGKGNNHNFLEAEWGYYSQRLEVLGGRVASSGYLDFAGGENVALFLSACREGTRYQRVAEARSVSVRYSLSLLKNDKSGTENMDLTLFGKVGAADLFSKGKYIVSASGYWPHLSRDAQLIMLERDPADPRAVVLFSQERWLPTKLTPLSFDGYHSVPRVYILDQRVEDIQAVYAFESVKDAKDGGMRSLGVQPVPLLRESKGIFVALVDKPGQESLVAAQKAGRAVYMALWRTDREEGGADIVPVTVTDEGFNSVRFSSMEFERLYASLNKDPLAPARFAFTLAIASKAWDQGDFVLLPGAQGGRSEGFFRIQSIQTEVEFAEPPPEWAENVVFLDKPWGELRKKAYLKPYALDQATGALKDARVYLNPGFEERNRAAIQAGAGRNLWISVSSPRAAPGERLFIASAAGTYALDPNYGAKIYDLINSFSVFNTDASTRLKIVMNAWKNQAYPGERR